MTYEKLLEKIAEKEKNIGLTDTEKEAISSRLAETSSSELACSLEPSASD